MVLAAGVDSVDVHAAIVGPVVGQGDEELDAVLGGGIDDLVKARQVNGGCPVRLEPLEDCVGRTRALGAVGGQSRRVVGPVLVVEAPGPEDGEASLLGSGQTSIDIGSVLCLRSICLAKG